MSVDWNHIFEIAIGPVAGIASGLSASLLGMKHRLENVEKEAKELRESNKKHVEDRAAQAADIRTLQEVDRSHYERNKAFQEHLEEMKRQLAEDEMRDSSHDLAKEAAFANFMTEQQEQWQLMQRTLGQLEGHLGFTNLQPAVPIRPPRPAPQRQLPPALPSPRKR